MRIVPRQRRILNLLYDVLLGKKKNEEKAS
jgi:hypothetical protein